MQLLLSITFTLLAYSWAQSSEYLPPGEDQQQSGAASNVVETNFLENEPAHSLADDGYRYKTVKRYRLRHRRDVNEISNNYLAPQATSAGAETAPAPVFVAAADAGAETYDVGASEPVAAHSYADNGYRYKTVKRYRLRHRF